MTDFMINLFVPDNMEGSIAAVQAHVCATSSGASIRVERCTQDTVQDRVESQLHTITIADGMKVAQPEKRRIWIVGFENAFQYKLYDELYYYAKIDRTYAIDQDWQTMYIRLLKSWAFDALKYPSVVEYAKAMNGGGLSDYIKLRAIYGAEDFEILIAHLLNKNPEQTLNLRDHFALKLLLDRKR